MQSGFDSKRRGENPSVGCTEPGDCTGGTLRYREKVTEGEFRVTNGRRRVTDGTWLVTGGSWRVIGRSLLGAVFHKMQQRNDVWLHD